MNIPKQIAAALTLASAFGINAHACQPTPDADNATLPVMMGVNDNKMYLSQGFWFIARGKTGQLEVSSGEKCPTESATYNAASARMIKLATDGCGKNTNIVVKLEEGSKPVTAQQMKEFCGNLGTGAPVAPR